MAAYPEIYLQIIKITFKGIDCQGDLPRRGSIQSKHFPLGSPA
jgi:hypothetical protein